MGRGSGQAFRLSSSDRLELQRLVRTGRGYAESASAVGCSAKSVQRLLIKTGGLKPRNVPRSMLRLSAAEREEILPWPDIRCLLPGYCGAVEPSGIDRFTRRLSERRTPALSCLAGRRACGMQGTTPQAVEAYELATTAR